MSKWSEKEARLSWVRCFNPMAKADAGASSQGSQIPWLCEDAAALEGAVKRRCVLN